MDKVLELDNLDKTRIDNNINSLKEKNIPYLKYMVSIPINSLTKIKSVNEIVDKMLVDYVIACSASLMIDSSIFLIGDFLDKINSRYQTDNLLTLEDKMTIINIIDKFYTIDELEDFCRRYESVNICLWALGFIDEIDSYKKCNTSRINKIMLGFKSYGELIKSSKLRSKEEILRESDLITRYYWAFRQLDNDEVKERLNEDIIDIQNDTLEFITSYSYDSLKDKYLKIEYSKDDLKFNFDIPCELRFEKISDDSKELFALKSEDGRSRIVAFDLGRIDIGSYKEKTNKNINLFVNNDFTLVNKYDLHSTSLNENIVRAVIKKDNFSLNVYYIYISNHLIRIDSLIEAYIDCSNYEETINSKNTNIDYDLIFSIKEVL